ncbi:non-intrinsic ABC protein 6 [Wolffia australiana]
MAGFCCGSSSLPRPAAAAGGVRWRRSRGSRRRPAVFAALSDPFVLEIAEKLEDSLSLGGGSWPAPLQKLRETSSESLLSRSWPSSKDEPFRFTDTSFLKQSTILPVPVSPSLELSAIADRSVLSPHVLTVVDGQFVPSLSKLASLPAGVFAGGLSDFPPGPALDKITEILSKEKGFHGGDLFWDINGAGAPDISIVYVPEGARLVEEPLFLRFFSLEGGNAGSNALFVSNPRTLVVVEKGAELAIVEEHLGGGESKSKSYWSNSVVEISLAEGARLSHSYLQQQSPNAAHIKWTLVKQGSGSAYEMAEVSTGGRLSRHNLHVEQRGPETKTELATFQMSRRNQTQDLHSRLVLDHPGGFSRQLHKCIVSDPSGQAVFDGNVMVNRRAQQTDAGQLTRSLLLAPRATVNVKPNLQIIADDVKCSHGAAISDLEEDQLFYFQTRGISRDAAREALIFSFGAEVLDRLPFLPLRKAVSSHVKALLAAKHP